jgi:hypothetical protein
LRQNEQFAFFLPVEPRFPGVKSLPVGISVP